MRTGDVVGGRYQLEDARGGGAGGLVWTAFDRKLKRTVALKRPHTMASAADRAQFRREAENAAQVQHPNAISVFDTIDGDECWLVMEHLPTDSLDKILAEHGTLPPHRVARIGVQIAAALAAVHARKIVHRDVKPGNILVTGDDLAKLTDFGISIWCEVTGTDDGRVTGTPAFMAPEVAAGRAATGASDVFSLGATLFTALEGTPPFGTGEVAEVVARAREGRTEPMANAGPLALLITRMLERNPRRRPTADEVRRQLREIVGDWEPEVPKPPRARRRLPVRAAAAFILVAATIFLVAQQNSSPVATEGLVGEERTADPCSLIRLSVFRDFGPPELKTDYGNFNRCDVLIDVGREEKLDVEVQLVKRASQTGQKEWRVIAGNPFDVLEAPSGETECNRLVRVDETYGVRVSAKLANSPRNLCEVADVAVETVRDVLRQGPIPRRAKDFPPESLARVNACALLPAPALAHLEGMNPGVDVFGDWSCKWSTAVTRTEVHLRYDQHATMDWIKGLAKRLGGHEAYVELDTHSGQTCTVQVPYRPANSAPRSHVDVLRLTVRGNRPGPELCPEAERLATTAAINLHRR
ncbi:protein kinase [Allokutzneria sp. A3M-2-11 16]|uniref:serine/threonine-protein kinase n=1 Tax=Allokutzneria sp. A3M-2-11 16 TaxID=2962043 RepID=UPI0020B7A52B|nr:serine/threonine-protein kinase [Allokutzneria sp. A3M-2-11 16]MCP3803145.1 protein kinase [Allokutzneria sp. A3M-2-11 16]